MISEQINDLILRFRDFQTLVEKYHIGDVKHKLLLSDLTEVTLTLGERDVAPLTLQVSVEWLGDA